MAVALNVIEKKNMLIYMYCSFFLNNFAQKQIWLWIWRYGIAFVCAQRLLIHEKPIMIELIV